MSELHKQWKRDEQAHFEGWDFSYIEERMTSEKPPWDYNSLARQLISKSKSLLDMATGGGERLLSLAPLPEHTVATEGWKPNVEVARRRLKPIGVKTVSVDEEHKELPFDDSSFDTVINHHGAFEVEEVYRVLGGDGVFLTQQVGGDNLYDLVEFFDAELSFPRTLKDLEVPIRNAGFSIEKAEEWRGKRTFLDVGAIVYYLRAIPWIVKGFSADTHSKYLERLQTKLTQGDKLEFTDSRYLILLKKQAL